MAICARVSINRRAHRAGDARKRLQTGQSAVDGEIHQVLQKRTGIRLDTPVRCHQPASAIAQHDPAKAGVRYDQVGAAADDHRFHSARSRQGKRGDESFRIFALGVEIGWSADAESRIAGERSSGQNG